MASRFLTLCADSLARINLENNELTDASIPYLSRYLQFRNYPLEVVNLSKNFFTNLIFRAVLVDKVASIDLSQNEGIDKYFLTKCSREHRTQHAPKPLHLATLILS